MCRKYDTHFVIVHLWPSIILTVDWIKVPCLIPTCCFEVNCKVVWTFGAEDIMQPYRLNNAGLHVLLVLRHGKFIPVKPVMNSILSISLPEANDQ